MFLPIDATSGENLDRMVRVFARFTSVGCIVYALLLSASIADWSDRMDGWWTPFAAITVFGCGLLPGIASFFDDIRLTRAGGAAAAITYLVAVATFPLAWHGEQVDSVNGIWLASFPGLASVAAVLAWPAWGAFAHMVAACVSVQIVNQAVRYDAAASSLIPEIAFALMFCSLFVGGSVMALRTARLLDETTDETHSAAGAAAAQRARTVERARFDALTHDGVMATLLVASRAGTSTAINELAAGTIAELDDIRAGARIDRPFTVDQAVVHLRAAAADADGRADFAATVDETADTLAIPAEVVWTLGAAVSEALRNSVRHAGPTAVSRVEVRADGRRIAATVRDDGVGFDPRDVGPHRLGIAVSIRGRMRSLPGGSADVQSRPGDGVVVRLGWRA